jgi:DNA-binding IclR family transcriptional regulator
VAAKQPAGGESVGTVARAIQLLRVVAESDEPQTVTGLAKALDLPSSTVHRLLQLLREQGMIAGDSATRRYVPGRELFRLAAMLSARRSVAELARPVMERVVATCNETCVLSTLNWEDHQMVFVEQIESTHPLRFSMPLHEPLPLIWGATGVSIVARLGEAEVEELLAAAGPSPVEGSKPPLARTFKQELARIRERGYAVTEGQKIADSVGIASAVLDHRGQPVGSLALTIPISRYEPKSEGELGLLVMDAAAEISNGLGYSAEAAGDGAG